MTGVGVADAEELCCDGTCAVKKGGSSGGRQVEGTCETSSPLACPCRSRCFARLDGLLGDFGRCSSHVALCHLLQFLVREASRGVGCW